MVVKCVNFSCFCCFLILINFKTDTIVSNALLWDGGVEEGEEIALENWHAADVTMKNCMLNKSKLNCL